MNVVRLQFPAALAAALLIPAAAAQAQWYGPAPGRAPAYPAVVRGDQPYAVEIAPGTYVIHRPPAHRHHRLHHAAARAPHAVSPARPDLTIQSRRIVHERPVVVETTRVVDDPPRVIERRHYVDEPAPAAERPVRAVAVAHAARAARPARSEKSGPRVIHAEAEVTILGPDRMSIRLFRRGTAAKARAAAD